MTLANIFDNKVLDQLELNLNSNEVNSNTAFVYIVNLANYKQTISLFWECLSIEEKIKAKQYYASSLTDRYVMSHGILRYILSFYTKQLPQDIEFIHNDYGKPFLKNHNIYFNMSHSHDMVSYIISFNYIVGIDIELHNSVIEIDELSDLVFTPKEQAFIKALDPEAKLSLFYNLWTIKESLVKARGQGLSYPINTIEVMELSPGEKVCLSYENNTYKQKWYYFPLEIAEGYSASIAVEHKINKIIYVEMDNQKHIFNNLRFKYFS